MSETQIFIGGLSCGMMVFFLIELLIVAPMRRKWEREIVDLLIAMSKYMRGAAEQGESAPTDK